MEIMEENSGKVFRRNNVKKRPKTSNYKSNKPKS